MALWVALLLPWDASVGAASPRATAESEPPRPGVAAPAPIGTPVSSAPTLAPPARSARHIDRARLQAAVDRLAHWATTHGGRATASVLQVDDGEALAGVDERAAENPASNAKLLTAAVALIELGPAHRFKSGLYGHVEGGVATDVTLRSNGDPSLGAAELRALAAALVDGGLTRIAGDLLVDQSYFDEHWVPPAFEQQPGEWAAFRAPVSAVALERNAVTLVVRPTHAKSAARSWFEPAGFVHPTGRVMTGSKGSGQKIGWPLRADASGLSATLGGHIAEGLPEQRFQRRVDDPRLYAGRVLAGIFASLGVKLGGSVKLGGASAQEELASRTSAPLSDLLSELGKHSDNFYAEMVLKTIGAERTKQPGSSADGATAVSDWLARIGAADPGTRIVNGSGLFDANRVTTHGLVTALSAAYRDPAISSEYVAQLAIGGVDGTLASRFRSLRERRQIRAKTGTLAGTVALGGYVLGADGSAPIAFSIIVTGIADHEAARREVDRVVEAIARERG